MTTPTYKTISKGQTAAIIASIFGAIALMAVVGALSPPKKENTEDALIYDAKSAVRRVLKDPESAQFSGVFVNGNVACGNVNSRNSFGGYTGLQGFIAISGFVTLEEQTNGFDAMWSRVCLNRP